MPKPQKEPLRRLSQQAQQELQRIVKATSERMDVIKRARALLAVAGGHGFSSAAREAGFASGDTVCHLVKRFNQQGLSALLIATGRGRKPTYTNVQRRRRSGGIGITGGGPMSGPSPVLVSASFWFGIIWQDISPMRWYAGYFTMGFFRSIRRWVVPG